MGNQRSLPRRCRSGSHSNQAHLRYPPRLTHRGLMFTRIDHVTICVPDLLQGMERLRKLGFDVHMGGVHAGKGTHNAIAFNEDDYIELLAIRDEAEYRQSGGKSNIPGGTLPEFVAAGGGIRYV